VFSVCVNGCWVGRNVVSGLFVFVGGDSSLSVLQGLLWFLHFSTLACFCNINVKKFLCCSIM